VAPPASLAPKLPSKPSPTRRVPLFLLRGFWDELNRRGVPMAQLERASGVPRPRHGDCTSTISAADMYRVFEASQALSGDAHIGLHVGRAIGASGFHIVGHLVLASATLPQAMEAVLRVQPYIRRRPLRFEEHVQGLLRVGFAGREHESEPGHRVEAELTAVVLHDVVLHFFADDTRERPSIELPFAAPADLGPYRRTFPGGVRFDAEGTFVCFPRAALTRHRSGSDPGLLEQLLSLAHEQYGAANITADWTDRVRSTLRAQTAPRLINAADVAKQLGVSARGLSRRLAREGASLSGLLEEALYERACSLLKRPDATTAQVADALGYAELSSFYRAFRRWSGGLTPNAHRRRHADDERMD